MPAADDLEQIKPYSDKNYPRVSPYAVRSIFESIRSLKSVSNRSRPGQRAGTRELVLHPSLYVVVNRLKKDAIEILHLYHGAQQRDRS